MTGRFNPMPGRLSPTDMSVGSSPQQFVDQGQPMPDAQGIPTTFGNHTRAISNTAQGADSADGRTGQVAKCSSARTGKEADRSALRVRVPQHVMVGGPGDEHPELSWKSTDDVQVEDHGADVRHARGTPPRARSMEAKRSVAVSSDVERAVLDLGAHRRSCSADSGRHHGASVSRGASSKPISTPLNRGQVQGLKKGIAGARRLAMLVMVVAAMDVRFCMVEGFSGHSELSRVANEEGWRVLRPRDILFGDDLSNKVTAQEFVDEFLEEQADFVVLEPPCGPWSS